VLLIFTEPREFVTDFLRVLENDINKLEYAVIFTRDTKNYKIHLRNNIVLTLNFIQLIKFGIKFKPDIIHTAGWKGFDTLLWWLYAKFSGKVLAVELDLKSPLKYKIIDNIKKIKHKLFLSIPNVILPSGTSGSKYLTKVGVPEKKICIQKMTVDINRLQAINLCLKKTNKTTFLFVGRIIKRKRVQMLISAFCEMYQYRNDIELIIVGDGPYYKSLKDSVNNISDIKFTGHLSGTELYNTYVNSDIFVLPAIQEPWGLVINEAMAFGLPVITTSDVGAAFDLVHNNENGYIIDTIDELVNAMKFLVENQIEIKRMGVNSKKIISEWTMENQVNCTINAWSTHLDKIQ